MIALLTVDDSGTRTVVRDARCHDAAAPDCSCTCGGRTHGTGRARVAATTCEHVRERLDRATEPDPPVVTADIMPALLLSPGQPGRAVRTVPAQVPEAEL